MNFKEKITLHFFHFPHFIDNENNHCFTMQTVSHGIYLLPERKPVTELTTDKELYYTYILQNSNPVVILYKATINRSGRIVNINKKQSRHNMKPNTINWKANKKGKSNDFSARLWPEFHEMVVRWYWWISKCFRHATPQKSISLVVTTFCSLLTKFRGSFTCKIVTIMSL